MIELSQNEARIQAAPFAGPPSIRLFKVNMADDMGLVTKVLQSGYVGQGERVEALEAALQRHYRLPHRPVTINSATSGLHLALLLLGVGPGDEVITTPMTCSATNTPLVHLGARIVWADVDRVTGNIDPESVAQMVTPRTKAIIAVDWAGRPCDYVGLRLAAPGVPIVQDAAHCGLVPPGAEHMGRGDYIVWSYQAIKFLTCGDGGALFCTDPNDDARARKLRWYGLDRTKGDSFRCSQDITEVGHKWHMNDVAAAIGLSNLAVSVQGYKRQGINAAHYEITLPSSERLVRPPWSRHCGWWLYTLLVEDRDGFELWMREWGIETSQVHRRNDLHTAFAAAAWEDPQSVIGRRPGLDHFAAHQVAVPVGWWLTETELEYVCQAIQAWHDQQEA